MLKKMTFLEREREQRTRTRTGIWNLEFGNKKSPGDVGTFFFQNSRSCSCSILVVSNDHVEASAVKTSCLLS
jgi:hypothetical protein